jgi:hypothetical protein
VAGGPMSHRGRERRWAGCSLTAALLLLLGGVLGGVLGGACSEGGGSSTTSTLGPETTATFDAPSTTAIPTLTDQQEVELQARAIARTWHGPRLCMNQDGASADLRAALAPLYEEILYVELVNFAPSVGWDHCTLVSAGPARWLAAEVVGIDVWSLAGLLSGIGETYLFRWDGSAWVDATPEETGVTVTTAVS